jgi:hypothetical protein
MSPPVVVYACWENTGHEITGCWSHQDHQGDGGNRNYVCRIHPEFRCAGVTRTSWQTESPGNTRYLNHPEFICAGFTRNTGIPESSGTQGCRSHPVSSKSGVQVV